MPVECCRRAFEDYGPVSPHCCVHILRIPPSQELDCRGYWSTFSLTLHSLHFHSIPRRTPELLARGRTSWDSGAACLCSDRTKTFAVRFVASRCRLFTTHECVEEVEHNPCMFALTMKLTQLLNCFLQGWHAWPWIATILFSEDSGHSLTCPAGPVLFVVLHRTRDRGSLVEKIIVRPRIPEFNGSSIWDERKEAIKSSKDNNQFYLSGCEWLTLRDLVTSWPRDGFHAKSATMHSVLSPSQSASGTACSAQTPQWQITLFDDCHS